MDRPEDWTQDSTEVVRLHLEGPIERKVTVLPVTYTYSIFGDAEKIFGYKNLSITVSLARDSLLTLLEATWSDRISPSLGIEAEDLDAAMSPVLPADTFRDRARWQEELANERKHFRPKGQAVQVYDIRGKRYTIYRASLADPTVSSHLARMQPLSILYIEGASLIDTEDEAFDLYTIYAEVDGLYEFIGYSTCYQYRFYDKIKHSFDHIRYRISQFLILPCHQGLGHGGRLYDAIFGVCQDDARILEVTVEDPSEAFDDLRDRRDLARLRAEKIFQDKNFALPISKEWVSENRRRTKIAPRQFARLVEMNLLAKLDQVKCMDESLLRKYIKSRLYKKNLDIMIELPKAERISKLEETYRTQTADYRRLLDSLQNKTPSSARLQDDLHDSPMVKKQRLN